MRIGVAVVIGTHSGCGQGAMEGGPVRSIRMKKDFTLVSYHPCVKPHFMRAVNIQ